MNRQYAETRKERKDAGKRHRDRKMMEKEKREKVNREWAEDGLSQLLRLETTPEPDLSPSASGDVDYSMLETPNTGAARGQSPGQRRVGAKASALAVGEGTPMQTTSERSPARPDVETLGRVMPPRPEVGLDARPLVTRREPVSRYEPQGAA